MRSLAIGRFGARPRGTFIGMAVGGDEQSRHRAMSTGAATGRLWERRLPADPPAVGQARVAAVEVARGAGASADEVERIRLAVSEAVSNSVRHAYAMGGRRGTVHVVVDALGEAEIVVRVADDGRGLGSPSPNPGLGLGMKVMAKSADDLAISRRRGGGTEIRLTFRRRRGACD